MSDSAFPWGREDLARALPWVADAYEGRCFTADLNPPQALHAAFVRSPHPHAEILSIDLAPASDPDVVACWTARDLPAHINPIPCIIPLLNRDGSSRADPPRTLMASTRCRHEGEIVAMVVARSEQAALRAAARVQVHWRPLAAVVDAWQALLPDAPQVWDETAGNLCFDWELGDAAARDEAFARAAHVVRRRLRNNRIIISPLETRNAIAAHIESTDSFLLVTATQGANWVREVIARDVLGWDSARLEVLTPLVGGSFGSKIFVYPEQILVLLACERLRATVKWSATRAESFRSDIQGRDNHTQAALALDAEGKMLAIATETVANLGAHLSNYAPFSATTCGAPLLCGIYQIGTVHARVRGAFTHTTPIDSYRGAGRPEAHYVLERMIDEAAAECGFDPVELRLKNAIDESRMPFTTATGIRIDSGMFRQNIRRALQEADYAGFEARRAHSASRGWRRGIGMANFLETNGGFALARIMERESGGLPRETARIEVTAGGRLRLDIGTQGAGQDHRGAYARILARHLGVPAASIDVYQGRSDRLRHGTGTGGSKSMLSGSTAILEAADQLVEKARRWLATRTRRALEDVAWTTGFLVLDQIRLTLTDAARMACDDSQPGHPFDAECTATVQSGTFANGCHVCEVEVHPATGVTRVVRYTAVADFGHVISEADVLAQQHGGIAQGIGQALIERCAYDTQGRLATADLATYHLPQAADMPPIQVVLQGSACDTNRLGLKGCGEAAASAAPPAVINALHDALRAELRRPLQMPATSDAVWAALQATESA